MFAPDELLLALVHAGVRFVIIGGVAVGVHGYVRATKDLDIVPDPDPANLRKLAALLGQIGAQHVGVGDFTPEEFPFDPLNPSDLGRGANFRLDTRLGPLDIMQWLAGIDDEPAYAALARDAVEVSFRGECLLVCGLDHLRAMKRAAGRAQDLLDLTELETRG